MVYFPDRTNGTTTTDYIDSNDTSISRYWLAYTSITNTEDNDIDYTALWYNKWIDRKRMYIIFKELYIIRLKINTTGITRKMGTII